MAKKKTEDTINLDSILFKCRDILRAARNSGSFFEKRDMMLTLVFLRFIGEKYEDGIEKLRQILIEQGLDPDDENIRAAFFDDATFADGTYNLSPEARWSTIINTPAPKLNVALDNALHSIAASSKQLKGCFVEGTFTTRNLAANDIKKLIDEVNKISHKQFGEEKDLIGRVYEYFLKEFAVNATKEEGEFYTPHDAVQLIATMIEPYDGTLYDPCCGSGGMFIQSAALVKSKQGDINRINVYGQEKEPATYRLAKMNLALRGISHNLGETSDSSFLNDLHKGLYFDYTYTVYSCGQMKVEIQGKAVQRGKLEPAFLPRIGVIMKGNKNFQKTMWYGMGPGESYVDSKAASIMGIYENTVDGMMTDYVFPQENGHHEQVKWFRIGDGKDGLLCKMEEKLGLNLANYTDESLEKAQHPFEIEKADDVIIHLDYRQSGLGSNSCGEEQLEENKVKLQDFAMAFTVQAAECGTEIRKARKQYID